MRIETLGKMHEIEINTWTTVAGPCSAETEDQILQTAREIAQFNCQVLRAGIWKPRTRAGSWQGVGEKGLEWMVRAKREVGIAIATEVKDPQTLELALRTGFDILWIGSRNGTNFSLLEEVGRQTTTSHLPIILKRTMGGDLADWLGAAEYILRFNPHVVLCERGISGFPRETRFVLDIQTAKIAQVESKLPVIVDVSHAAGRRDLIEPMARAVRAAGFNGVMVEVHPDPDRAITDAKQQISLKDFGRLMEKLSEIPLCL